MEPCAHKMSNRKKVTHTHTHTHTHKDKQSNFSLLKIAIDKKTSPENNDVRF